MYKMQSVLIQSCELSPGQTQKKKKFKVIEHVQETKFVKKRSFQAKHTDTIGLVQLTNDFIR